MNLYECSYSELEEMGISLQCECLSTYRECDETTGRLRRVRGLL